MEIKLPFTRETAERFDSLFQWLNRKYRLELIEQPIGGAGYRLYKVQNIEQVIDDVLELKPNPDDDMPYWAELWPSSVALSQFISRMPEIAGKSLLELGSGLGLCGIVAAKMGARVVESDFIEDALRIAEMNWLMNTSEAFQGMLLDWRHPPVKRKFHILLASDVAYEERHFHPLLSTFNKLLAPGGEILLSEPNRTVAKEFFQLLKKNNYTVEKYSESISYRGRELEIGVYRMWR